jgi:hypothetical protein
MDDTRTDMEKAMLLSVYHIFNHDWNQFWHVILIPSHPVCILPPQCCVLSGETTNSNLIIIGLTPSVSNPRYIALKTSTLTITSPMRLHNRYKSADRKNSQKTQEYMLNYSLQCSCSYNLSSFWLILKQQWTIKISSPLFPVSKYA